MWKRNLISLGALGVFAVLATGSTPDLMQQVQQQVNAGGGGGGGGNHAACLAYVAHYNSLSCITKHGVTFDAGDMCPEALDMNPNDMSAYYQCLSDNSKCNGDIPDLAGAASCSP